MTWYALRPVTIVTKTTFNSTRYLTSMTIFSNSQSTDKARSTHQKPSALHDTQCQHRDKYGTEMTTGDDINIGNCSLKLCLGSMHSKLLHDCGSNLGYIVEPVLETTCVQRDHTVRPQKNCNSQHISFVLRDDLSYFYCALKIPPICRCPFQKTSYRQCNMDKSKALCTP